MKNEAFYQNTFIGGIQMKMNSILKRGDIQTKSKPKIYNNTGLPPLLSPRIKIDPSMTTKITQTFRSPSTLKKLSIEKKEDNRPVTDNTQKQKSYSSVKKSKVQGMIIRKLQNHQVKFIKSNTESQEMIENKFQSPAIRMIEFPINDFQDDTIIKEETVSQIESFMENRFTAMKNQSFSSSQKQAIESSSSNKIVNDSSTYSQFNFSTQNPSFTEGDMIGAGSFGQVYIAQENKTGKIYAVKKINLKGDFEQEDLQGLKSEIDLLKRIKHKNIIRYAWSQQNEEYWLLYLEYMSQGTLTQLTEKFGPLNINTVRTYSEQLLSAIAYLHDNNIIHRDIKGANVLLGVNGEVKLGDFGCSKIKEKTISRSKQGGDILHSLKGSIPYMAPEVASQDENCRASDIWSFGCTVLEMATGKKPWHEHNFDNPLSALLLIISENALPRIPEDLDEVLSQFIRLCLQRDHLLRPTAQELLQHQFIIKK
ncbi:unnamed protein product (macronuclear) [Paramecium tetraurelia]|uniref:Protein kinase domain-containing protein n=1 Tax=Paramecium tetraurelia TaxID=5888 RepID=A0E2W6_PARTE|nr:uncharacterized protein GSPATT00022805001 [Paramecium tetraurelia]CAK89633.1 unnamed protein product [Paramecium tetraurelia]|eukprot:XP_001457030.1 hypothetical protein (macronuclear) [Paramecium tetraurelia strain d4-2]